MNLTTNFPPMLDNVSFDAEHWTGHLKNGEQSNTTMEDSGWADFEREGFVRSILGIVIGVFGLPTTLLLLAVTLTPAYRKHSYSLYLSVMCVYDFTFVLVNFSESVLYLSCGQVFRDVLLWEVSCRLYEYVWYTSVTISIWLNVAVTVDRYIVIAYTFQKDRWCTRKNSWIVTGGLVLLVHAIGSVYIVYGKVKYIPEDDSFSCDGQDILHDLDMFMSDLAGVLPAVVFIFIFTLLSVVKLSILKAERMKMTSRSTGSSSRQTTASRTTTALVVINLGCVVTQVPYLVDEILVTYAYYYDVGLYDRLWDGTMPVYHTALAVCQSIKWGYNIQNFFVFYALSHQFRKDVLNMVTSCGRRRIYRQRPNIGTENIRMHATVSPITSTSSSRI